MRGAAGCDKQTALHGSRRPWEQAVHAGTRACAAGFRESCTRSVTGDDETKKRLGWFQASWLIRRPARHLSSLPSPSSNYP